MRRAAVISHVAFTWHRRRPKSNPHKMRLPTNFSSRSAGQKCYLQSSGGLTFAQVLKKQWLMCWLFKACLLIYLWQRPAVWYAVFSRQLPALQSIRWKLTSIIMVHTNTKPLTFGTLDLREAGQGLLSCAPSTPQCLPGWMGRDCMSEISWTVGSIVCQLEKHCLASLDSCCPYSGDLRYWHRC